ncbi:MAG: cobalamin B12-binding domain-containing protein [Burkholderiales bacterium]
MSAAIETIKDWIIRGKKNEAIAATNAALADNVDPGSIMKDGLIAAMAVVGEKYSSGEFFLPQMMIAARALSEVIIVLKPHLTGAAAEKKGKVVIGTVAGDFHNIGKDIVKMMMEGAGYEVLDLGVDVSPERFVEAVKSESPDFVLMSALITLTMDSMRRTVEALNASGIRSAVKVGVGGAPLTHKFAQEIGADFYSEDAHQCVQVCNSLLQ